MAATAQESQPKPDLHLPMQRSSSVSASPINSNLKSLSEWANFRWAAERPRKKDLMMTWFLALSQGLQDIYSSKGQYSCRALLHSIWEEAQPNSFAKRPIIPTWHTLQVASVFYSTLRQAQSRCWNVYSTPQTLLPQRANCFTLFPKSTLPFSGSLRSALAQFKSSG